MVLAAFFICIYLICAQWKNRIPICGFFVFKAKLSLDYIVPQLVYGML